MKITQRRMEAGLCASCDRPASGDHRYCDYHLEMHRADARRRNAKRKTRGECLQCGTPTKGSYCDEHREPKWQQAVERSRRTRKILRDEVYRAYGSRCACCGEDHQTMLSIDHIDGNGADHRQAVAIERARSETADKYEQADWRLRSRNSNSSQMHSWLKANGFPPGFQVLCMNCNVSKYRNGGTCEHSGV